MGSPKAMPDIHFRPANPSDLEELQALLASFDMTTTIEPQEFLIAEKNGTLLGAIRTEHIGNFDFIRPVIVAEKWQGQDIGAALVHAVQANSQALAVVARGPAQGFYAHLGFSPSSWDWLPESLRQECEECPEKESCSPAVMIWQRTSEPNF